MTNKNTIESVYKEMILDLCRNPLNKKQLADFDFQNRQLNPTCGDEIEISIKFDEEDRVKDIGHRGEGCAISQASVSLLTDHLKGKTKEEIKKITKEEMLNLLEIPISHTRLKCALLAWKTIQEI